MVTLADLARWTPVALHLDGAAPAIDWCDFGGEAFSDPFFDQTVARLVADRPMVRTDLDTLLALDGEPSLEPAGMIFHMSRCGSTLLSRLLGCVPGTLVVSEPAPLNALLQVDPARIHPEIQVQVARLLVRALGRVRLGSEKRLVLKLSSWNVRRAAVLLAAFPAAPTVWVTRDRDTVLASLAVRPPGWAALADTPAAAHLFGLDPGPASFSGAEHFMAQALDALVAAAPAEATAIDYRDLPAAAWTRAAPAFGMAPSAADITAMQAEARYSAKQPGRVPFVA